MDRPDLTRSLLLAKLSSLIYLTELNEISDKVAELGLSFVGVVEAPGFQALVCTENDGGQIVAFRGTPVTCGRDIDDAITALGYDVDLSHTVLVGGAKVVTGPYRACLANWLRISRLLDLTKPVTFTGHSLGAVCALISAALIPRSADLSVIVFAPFQAANVAFWAATFGGRPAPVIYGRGYDFALGHDHLDPVTCHAAAIWHIKNKNLVRIIDWPFFDESIPDHSVELYVNDIAELANG